MTLEQLFGIAKELHIDVEKRELKQLRAFAVPDGHGAIAYDPAKFGDERELKQAIAHEIGHCFVGAFYRDGDSDERKRACEAAADRWAINALVPLAGLTQAVNDGCNTLQQFAERFDVTEQFMQMALNYYTN